MIAGVLFIFAVVWLIGLVRVSKAHRDFAIRNGASRMQQEVFIPFLYWAERVKVVERFSSFLVRLQYRFHQLGVSSSTVEAPLWWLVQSAAYAYGAALFIFLFALLLGGDEALILIGFACLILLPLIRLRLLDRAVERRKRELLLELPVFLNQLSLMVHAGETVQRAIARCTDNAVLSEKDNHPLYVELTRLRNEFENQKPFTQSLEDFSRRCGIQEISVFSTTVMLNYKRGGEEFTRSLMELNRLMWEKRKALTRTLGEEASSKLIFPMALIFIAVLIVVAYPAIAIVNETN